MLAHGMNRTRQAGYRAAARTRALTESLEPRLLLAAQISSAMQQRIDPSIAEQALFANGTSQFRVASPLTGVGATYYRFATDAPKPIVGTFSIAPEVASPADAGLALYDGDGNLLAKADSDAVA